MTQRSDAPRVLIVPGLNGSGPAHWQTWLQAHHRHALRVEQPHWQQPDLDRWAERIGATIEPHRHTPWIAVAHSFGCLALARHLWLQPTRPSIAAAIFVAPASPAKFGLEQRLPIAGLPCPSVMVASDTDPWMSAHEARYWAGLWDSRILNLGDVGHINVASGFGPFPLAKSLVQRMIQRIERQRRLDRANAAELRFAG